VIHYQYASLLLYESEDYDGALDECEQAIKCDPAAETLLTLRALILTRLGRYSEAAPLYESLLLDLSNRDLKWRVSTRDQAAQCYRRFGEQDRSMKDASSFKKHIDRACKIVDDAIAAADIDWRTGLLYLNILEDGLFFAINERDDSYARILLNKLLDASHFLKMPLFRLLKLENFEFAFGPASVITASARDYFGRYARQDAVVRMLKAGSVEDRLVGKVCKIPVEKKYGFIADTDGHTYFIVPSFFRNINDWNLLQEGMQVHFTPSYDAKNRGLGKDVVFVTQS